MKIWHVLAAVVLIFATGNAHAQNRFIGMGYVHGPVSPSEQTHPDVESHLGNFAGPATWFGDFVVIMNIDLGEYQNYYWQPGGPVNGRFAPGEKGYFEPGTTCGADDRGVVCRSPREPPYTWQVDNGPPGGGASCGVRTGYWSIIPIYETWRVSSGGRSYIETILVGYSREWISTGTRTTATC